MNEFKAEHLAKLCVELRLLGDMETYNLKNKELEELLKYD